MSIALIPASAPFSSQQRAWLNGFFAGMLGSMEPAGTPAFSRATIEPASPLQAAEDFPWHDDSLSLEDRLTLAEGRPIERRLMAAMAQLDCGACGYVCQTYGEAIARGEETVLTRCAPGGAETAKALRQIIETKGLKASVRSPVNVMTSPPSNTHLTPSLTYGRSHPYSARLIESRRLTASTCAKDTRHVVIDLADSGIIYEPGGSLGIQPRNCETQVDMIIDRLSVSSDLLVPSGINGQVPLREALSRWWTISRIRRPILELFATLCEDARESRRIARWLKAGDDLPAADLLHLLEEFPSARPDPQALIQTLAKLQPRLYSISSSLAAHPGQVHLTVGVAQHEIGGRQRFGVASGYLGSRCAAGEHVDVFVQPSSRFRLPENTDAPIIMVGPGTGIAPFHAFLQHRQCHGHRGQNWLFFGNTSRELDFLYRDEIESYQRSGLLGRLDVAFSRDQTEKVYVQHRMIECGHELWKWLQDGAYFYVCGDAKRMAVDVDAALRHIACVHGGLCDDESRDFVNSLALEKRYRKDVY